MSDAKLSIAGRFRAIAAEFSAAEAVVTPRMRLTYAELDRWSDVVARDIADRDPPASSPVAIVTRDSLALVVATIAAAKAGRFFVAVDPSQPAAQTAAALSEVGATLCIVDETLPAGATQSQQLRIAPLPAVAGAPYHAPPHELVQLIFTSGTTGRPRVVASRQDAFVKRIVGVTGTSGRSAGQRVSFTALPGFARATHEILGSLLNGATLCSFDARSEPLQTLVQLVANERLDILTLTPALFRRFVKLLGPESDLSTLNRLRLGADVVNVADIEAYKAHFPRGCTLERTFNATETGPVLQMMLDHDTPVPGPLAPIGRPRPGVTVRLVDEDGHDVPDGTAGEMLVSSRWVVDGYWNDPEATSEKFFHDPATPGQTTFRTGDLALRDEEGLFYFLGRTDARLKVHGRRIDPLTIETELVAHAGAREAVVVGKPTSSGELQLAAYVVMRDGVPFVPRAIRTALRQRLAAWMVPARLFEMDAIPMSPGGKVDRRQLAERSEAPEEEHDNSVFGNDLEGRLATIWSEAIGERVNLDDDFFDDLGGESVVAAHLISEVNRAAGRAMPLSLLIELRTVRAMADYLRAEPDVDRVAVPIHAGRGLQPLFFVSGGLGSVLRFRNLAALLGDEQPFYGLTHHGFTPATFPRSLESLAACYVDAVRRIQPAGPYHLGGYSIGGRIAFAMARNLVNAGERVTFVGMLDTRATTEAVGMTRRLARYAATLRRRPFPYARRYARGVGRRILRLGRWLTGRGWTIPTNATPEIDALNAAFRQLDLKAIGLYRGRVTLFVADHGWGFEGVTPDLGWGGHCEGGVEVVRVAGDHHTMIREDVNVLGLAMKRELDRVRGHGEGAPAIHSPRSD